MHAPEGQEDDEVLHAREGLEDDEVEPDVHHGPRHPRLIHGTTTMIGGQVRTLLKLYYCLIFNFSILYVTY